MRSVVLLHRTSPTILPRNGALRAATPRGRLRSFVMLNLRPATPTRLVEFSPHLVARAVVAIQTSKQVEASELMSPTAFVCRKRMSVGSPE